MSLNDLFWPDRCWTVVEVSSIEELQQRLETTPPGYSYVLEEPDIYPHGTYLFLNLSETQEPCFLPVSSYGLAKRSSSNDGCLEICETDGIIPIVRPSENPNVLDIALMLSSCAEPGTQSFLDSSLSNENCKNVNGPLSKYHYKKNSKIDLGKLPSYNNMLQDLSYGNEHDCETKQVATLNNDSRQRLYQEKQVLFYNQLSLQDDYSRHRLYQDEQDRMLWERNRKDRIDDLPNMATLRKDIEKNSNGSLTLDLTGRVVPVQPISQLTFPNNTLNVQELLQNDQNKGSYSSPQKVVRFVTQDKNNGFPTSNIAPLVPNKPSVSSFNNNQFMPLIPQPTLPNLHSSPFNQNFIMPTVPNNSPLTNVRPFTLPLNP